VATGQGFEVRDLSKRGERGPAGTLRLLLEWPVESPPHLMLRGQLPPDGKDTHHRVDRRAPAPAACSGVSYDDVWTQLITAARRVQARELARWQATTGQRLLPISFDASLPEPARRTMRLDLDVPPTDLGRLGLFDATRLTQVKLVPSADSDAQAWAEWLQWDGLDRYATPSMISELAESLRSRFPYHHPHLPDASALLDRAKRSPLEPRARFLLAPADLGLWS
jgi:hypothetical protein